MKKCLVVIGMHRSGTSLVTGLLEIYGVWLGNNLMGVSCGGNEKGHFEHLEIVSINETILQLLGSSWDDLRPLSYGWQSLPEVLAEKEKIKKVLSKELIERDLIGIKDPRISILLPLYLDLFRETKINPFFIIMKRKEIEVAQSLLIRNSFPLEKSIKLYDKYVENIYTNLKSAEKIEIEFDNLLKMPAVSIKKIKETFDIRLKEDHEAEKAVSTFVEGKLKHCKDDYSVFLRKFIEIKDQESLAYQKELKRMDVSFLALESELKQKKSAFLALESELKQKKSAFLALESELKEKKSAFLALESELKEKKSAFLALESELKEKKSAFLALDSELKQKKNVILALDSELKEEKSSVLKLFRQLQQKEKVSLSLENKIKQKGETVVHLQNKIILLKDNLQKETNLAKLFEAEINRIKDSISWQFIDSLRQKNYNLFIRRAGFSKFYFFLLKLNRVFLSAIIFCFNYKGKRQVLSLPGEKKIFSSEPSQISERIQKINKAQLDKFWKKLPKGRICFPIFKKNKVSIILLTHNHLSFTYQCLKSILKHTTVSYELIIVDNASEDKTILFLDEILNVKIIKNKTNLRFSKASNQGAAVANGDYLLFLNNDTIVTPNWLNSLIEVAEKNSDCRAVGSKLVFPDGRLQEAGSILWKDGSAKGYGRGLDPDMPEFSYLRQVDYCSAASLLVQKKMFDEIGGFGEQYFPAYYEDTDLCKKIWQKGYKVYFQPESKVIHNEFTTNGSKVKEYSVITRKIFMDNWQGKLTEQLLPLEKNILFARNRNQGKKVLILDDIVPNSERGRGYCRMYQLIQLLNQLGYLITFYPLLEGNKYEPYTKYLQQLGIEVFFGDNLDFKKFAEDRQKYYDIIFVSRPHNMEKTIGTINKFFSQAVLIYDAEALYSAREVLAERINCVKQKIGVRRWTVEREIKLMSSADKVILVSPAERDKLLKIMAEPKKLAIWGHSLRIEKNGKSFGQRNNLLFVGGYLSPESPNEDAIVNFTKKVFPLIRKKINCKLYIVGECSSKLVKRLASRKVIVFGHVRDLRSFYEESRVFVVPHRFSAGLSWKAHEAMAYGLPTVVSGITAEQFSQNEEKAFLIANNNLEFAEKIIELYHNEQLWLKIQKNAWEFVDLTCNPEKMKQELKKIMDEAIFKFSDRDCCL
ncbi:MAG: glycosyltransferase [Candidatus Omnitrophica bacterium]|nr:glycosyltransferase [Candidatus Omnitrophota bacterium]